MSNRLKYIKKNILKNVYKNFCKNENTTNFSEEKLWNEILKIDISNNKQYTQWICCLILEDLLKYEDFSKLSSYLDTFDKHKRKISPLENRNIANIKSVPELYNIVKQFIEVKSSNELKKEEREEINKETKFIHNKNGWKILIPLTEKSSCFWGLNTAWCTAATKSDNMFNDYNNRGSLIIIITDKGEKFQLHAQSNSFMDSSDKDILKEDKEYIDNYLKNNCSDIFNICNMKKIENEELFFNLLEKYNLFSFPNSQLNNELQKILKSKSIEKMVDLFYSKINLVYFLDILPDCFYTERICKRSLFNNLYKHTIKNIPQRFFNQEVVENIHKENGDFLSYIPDKFITENNIEKACISGISDFDILPKKYQNQYRLTAILNNSNLLSNLKKEEIENIFEENEINIHKYIISPKRNLRNIVSL